MGLEMYLSKSRAQASSVETMCQSYKTACQELQTAADTFLKSTNELKGDAFDSARFHYSEVLLPLVKGAELMLEIAESEVKQFPEEFCSQVCGTDLKEDDLLARIKEQNEAMALVNQMQLNLARSSLPEVDKTDQRQANAALLQTHASNKKHLEELLQKLRDFNARSNNIFSKLAEIEALMNTGFSQAGLAWNKGAGMFITPTDLDWANTLNVKYFIRTLPPNEQQSIINLQKQYGFDTETAQQVLTVKKKIDKNFPNQSQKVKDYLLNRILGDFVYGEGKGYEGGAMWNATAGNINAYLRYYNPSLQETKTTSEALEAMGMTKEDVAKLRYNIRLQNNMAPGGTGDADDIIKQGSFYTYKKLAEDAYGPMSDKQFKEFWNKKRRDYSGKNDFAHQSITTATMLYDNPLRAPNALYGNEGTNELAGWRGDTTITPAAKKVSMGNDDYKADLDAVNITDIMEEKELSYLEASNYYYSQLEEEANSNTSKYTRAEKFKDHIDVHEVKYIILDNLADKGDYILEPGGTNGRNGRGYYKAWSEERRMTYLKENYPDSYNFIRSLEENDANLKDYASKE
ncbi:T7SS effector LXG polymorphic toxin [Streptococcus oricebi]|uniref:LXG domain-containing protein n=1 Tax=Streptococcus oricebi TaxID=1547447 RepID=A0ABS5B3V9_9STRE|nr:T7SS effector LXG polymorphic toxin [Streptococcus oricebi]MBP2623513.1 hypothetical protein [Streptococcus oricebi]